MKRYILIAILISSNALAGNYDWPNNDNTMNDWNRQNQINDMQLQNQRMIEQQNRQIQQIENQNYQLQQNLRREQILKNGGGRPNSLADELYR